MSNSSSSVPQRQMWSSRLTYLMTVAGSTIGFGATWRFPYLVGQNGGGAYVLVFCICMIVIGIPMILVENVIGRRRHLNAYDSFGGEANGKPLSKFWKMFGITSALGAFMILTYYMVLGGWVSSYIYALLSGDLNVSAPITKEVTSAYYDQNVTGDPLKVLLFTLIFIAVNYFILYKGIIDGIERTAKYLMPLLFVFVLIMIVRNVTLPGASKGIAFYLTPDFSKITPQLFVFVLGQVFFALSLGYGVIITLSSYLSREETLVGTSVITAIVNTVIAVMAGLMIFPSLFSFGLSPASGPALIFKTLPIVFSQMWGGQVFGVIFFCLLAVAAITSSLTFYEVMITIIQEKTKLSRHQSIFVVLAATLVLGNIPSLLSSKIFNYFDFISGNILFIITAFGAALFVAFGLKDEAKKELGYNASPLVVNIWFNYVKWVLPILIGVVFVYGLFF